MTGPQVVLDSQERLVSAAAELLSEVGPRAMSVRAVADRAEVNHGLVHYYFGSKDGLLRAAMTRLVKEHSALVSEMTHGSARPMPLGLKNDMRYLRAVVRCVLDGEMGLAMTELEVGESVPRRALESVLATSTSGEPREALKAKVALAAALEMGWAALEPFLFAVADVRPEEVDAVRELARTYRVSVTPVPAGRSQ